MKNGVALVLFLLVEYRYGMDSFWVSFLYVSIVSCLIEAAYLYVPTREDMYRLILPPPSHLLFLFSFLFTSAVDKPLSFFTSLIFFSYLHHIDYLTAS